MNCRKVSTGRSRYTPAAVSRRRQSAVPRITDGTILVVKIGSTTYDNVMRAIQTLCENNVLGIVANGARVRSSTASTPTTIRRRSKRKPSRAETQSTQRKPKKGFGFLCVLCVSARDGFCSSRGRHPHLGGGPGFHLGFPPFDPHFQWVGREYLQMCARANAAVRPDIRGTSDRVQRR